MKRFPPVVAILFATLLVALVLSSCNHLSDSEKQDLESMNKLLDEANSQVGLPAIKNFFEKKTAKAIFELRDQSDLVCYAYHWSDYNGKYVFLGECMGYGLPYSVQYTNPEKRVYESTTLPQADPNGLYMPDGLSATWVLLIDPKTGKAKPCYIEPLLSVFPFKLPPSVVMNY